MQADGSPTTQCDESASVCVLGLGLMGAPIARRLLRAGFSVSGWNRSAEKAEPLQAQGLRLGASAREATAGAAIVTLCLTDAVAVETVMFGPEGIADTIDPGAVVIDFSTVGVHAAQALGRRLKGKRGVGWIDAPVSGGPSGASEGRLAIFCGGEASDVARVRPVLEALSHVHSHMGPLGAGQATKLCNQLIVSTTLLAISEAVSLGRELGVDVTRLPDALAGGYADSRPLQIFGPRMAENAPSPRISEVATMLKDVRLVDASGGAGVNLRLTRAVLGLYEEAAACGLAHEDLAALPALSQPGWRERGSGSPP